MGKIREENRAFVIAGFIALAAGAMMAADTFLTGLNGDSTYYLNQRINPNTAGPGELMMLKGIGPSKAKAIVDYRIKNMSDEKVFADCNDLKKVSGIGPKTAEKLKGKLEF